jgi:DNA-binding NarL/FixJ family response regulator
VIPEDARAVHRRLDKAAARLRAAREAEAKAFEEARLAALDCIEQGWSESGIAQDLGVDRMTVRKWAGKR